MTRMVIDKKHGKNLTIIVIDPFVLIFFRLALKAIKKSSTSLVF